MVRKTSVKVKGKTDDTFSHIATFSRAPAASAGLPRGGGATACPDMSLCERPAGRDMAHARETRTRVARYAGAKRHPEDAEPASTRPRTGTGNGRGPHRP